MGNKLKSAAGEVCAAVLTIAIALAIGAVLVKLSGNDPVEAYQTLFRGAFGSKQRISEVFVKMVPLCMMAFGTSVAFRAQLWNIGGNGQFILGAVAAILPGLYLKLPPVILLPLSLICGMLGGALWAGLAAVLKIRFSANEVITTLMLNYIATNRPTNIAVNIPPAPNFDIATSEPSSVVTKFMHIINVPMPVNPAIIERSFLPILFRQL